MSVSGLIDPKPFEFVRFMRFVKMGPARGDCWEWTGGKGRDGYGIFSDVNRRSKRAHRWLFELLNGPLSKELVVRHRCDNPSCANPLHLEPGTALENSRDVIERAPPDARGRRPRITDAQVLEIRSAAACGTRHRDIAARYGISRPHVSNIIYGYRRPKAVAGAVGASVESLTDRIQKLSKKEGAR